MHILIFLINGIEHRFHLKQLYTLSLSVKLLLRQELLESQS
ncbi:hypothetical protein AD12_0329 [Escherichia coli 1-392-07_S4_C2]|nr:hypothetical protein AD12_0329 [Escherichia coli 1-392-07_S4_C2]